MDIYNLEYNQLIEELKANNIASFRAKQIWNWLYVNLVNSFDEMTNLDKKTIDFLKTNYKLEPLNVIKQQKAKDETEKILSKLKDGETIETVLMKFDYGYSVCVTTQIGCKIGCSFCASHLGGFKRNLETAEIVKQIIFFAQRLKKIEKRVSHVVIMGIGEPLDNLENVFSFINIINDQNGLKIGARHITLSTSGIVPKFDDIINYDKQINLAISLHASDNETRSRIMKINNVYNIEQIINATKKYIEKTNRRVSFEYILLKNINDREKDANNLVNLLRGINCHVNLIPFNVIEEYDYQTSNHQTINHFYEILKQQNIQVSIRNSKGQDIDGACGQLRRKSQNDQL